MWLTALLIVAAQAAPTPTHTELEGAAWAPLGTKKDADAGQVEIFNATVGGLDCYAAVAAVEIDPDLLITILSDPVSAMTWSSANISEAKILAKDGDHLEYYQHLSVPGWTMVQDRFWFSEGDIVRSDGKISWNYRNLEQGGPHGEAYATHREAHPKAIEPPSSVGTWAFETTDAGTRITYRMCADIGGSLPGSVERFASRQTLPNAVGDVVREGRRRTAASE